MPVAVVNDGEQHRLVTSVTSTLETSDDSVIFDLGNTLQIDWDAFQTGMSRSYMVKPADTITVDLTGLLVQVLIVSSDVPVQVNFTQDGVARTMRVKPVVSPTAWFASQHSPGEAPDQIQRGFVVLVGGDITVLSLSGITTMPSANVRVAFAAYRS